MTARRFFSIASALVVAAIAAYASYSHMRHLALEYGQDVVVSSLLPISVDGMLVVATVALGDGRRHRWSAWVAFWIGVAASIVANVLAAQPSAIARCISAWPAIAFLLVVEVITRGGRNRSAQPDATGRRWFSRWRRPTVLAVDEPLVAAEEPVEQPAVLAPEAAADDAPSDTPPEPHPTAVKIAGLRKRYPRITQQKAAQRLSIGIRTVQRHWPDAVPDDAPAEPVKPQVRWVDDSAADPANGKIPDFEGVPS